MFSLTLLGIFLVACAEASRILVCVPTPSVSHQVVFYPLIKELLKRGHEIVYITTDAMYPNGGGPANLTEIDTHDISYKAWRERVLGAATTQGNKGDGYRQALHIIPVITKSFELQMLTPEVQKLIQKKTHFDLLIIEGITKAAQALSHVFKAPMILMNSLGGQPHNYYVMGIPLYPKLLYPNVWHQKLNNLTLFDKIQVLWDTFKIERIYDSVEEQNNMLVKRLFGPDTPSLEECGNNAGMFFMNIYPIWEDNRPVPPGVVFIGGIHKSPQKELPKDLKAYLDSSERGVVYFSLGTNVSPSNLPADKIQAITKALARLNYDVLVKWDFEELLGKGNNTKVSKWLPQTDLLRHPKIKAFVTQGGLQSFDEAMTGGVPLVGIPMLGDQWYNVERYEALEVGKAVLMDDLTEDKLFNTVNTVIDDPSYRRNLIDLREKIRDQPESALDRAVWWTEHVIRHKGAGHLRAPAANMSWTEFLDLELWLAIASIVLTTLAAVAVALYLLFRHFNSIFNNPFKFKSKAA